MKHEAIISFERGKEFGQRLLRELSQIDSRINEISNVISDCQNKINIISGRIPIAHVSSRLVTEIKSTEAKLEQAGVHLSFFRGNSSVPRPPTPAPTNRHVELKRVPNQ
jgi:hypothetical protein